MDLSNIVTKSILELEKARVVENSAALLIQRQSSDKAEQVSVLELLTFTANSSTLDLKIKDVVNNSIGSAITGHSSSPDPHGDRAYTNNELVKHLNFSDPHGSNLYTTQAISNHTIAEDPHKDRAFAITAIETHSKAIDAHGDRLFTTTSLATHKSEEDPHGDRSYAFNLLQVHREEADPHSHKLYTNTAISNHNAEADPHGINAKIATAIAAHNTDENAHNLNTRLSSISLALRGDVDNAINQKVGVSIAPLTFGLIPKANLPLSVLVTNFANFPKTGVSEEALYIDKATQKSYIYARGGYQPLNEGVGGSNAGLTTDVVAPGVNLDRQYLTRATNTTINSKLNNVVPVGTGYPLVSLVNSGANTKSIKGIRTEGALRIEDTGVDLVLKTDDYNFEAYYDKNTLLTTTSDILKNISKNERIFLKGTIQAIQTKDTDSIRMVDKQAVWNLQALLGTTGTSTPLVSPTQIVQSSNGIIVTGTGVVGSFVEIYSAENLLLGTSTTLQSTAFSISLNRAYLDGEKLKIYTVTLEGNRSKPTIYYAHSSTSVRDIDYVSVSVDGLKVKGKTTRGSVVELTDNASVPLGTATADTNGNFTITSSKALVSNDTVVLTAKLGATLRATLTVVVLLPTLIPVSDIVINEFNTIITGKAEPTSLITLTKGSNIYQASTDAQGNFNIFTYSKPLNSGSNCEFKVTNEARTHTVIGAIKQAIVPVSTEPVVKDILLTEETTLIVSSVNGGGADEFSLRLVFNPITRELEVQGETTTTDTYINWEGTLNIKRYTRDK